MLKALELAGFKSFADKTRFEFPKGITVVVGPNGSGKSNVVDAIKWVLGEQSAKNLRGGEMADVIFNGSATRRPLNAAEVTLTLDNTSRGLAIDTPEVHITRRIYRSGECEYLINRQPARLRDIRDLLAGTGLGTLAYSVIEQGKVDLLLQASSRERHVIFEEAAGISRFRARKVEALRRLERVEQSLLRLSDIVEEVENRLRAVRLQAAKARRYREHTLRLQELRTQVAQVDWHTLSDRLAAVETELTTLQAEHQTLLAQAEALQTRHLQAEEALGQLDDLVRRTEAEWAAIRERIAAVESAIQHQRARWHDLDEEQERLQRQWLAMHLRADNLQQQLEHTRNEFESAQGQHRQLAQRLAEEEDRLSEVLRHLDQLRHEQQHTSARHRQLSQEAAQWGQRTSSLEAGLASAEAARRRLEDKAQELATQIDASRRDLESLLNERADRARTVEELRRAWQDAQDRLAEHRQAQAARHSELVELRQRYGSVAGRAAVLEELEKRYEGLSPGVKEVLSRARGPDPGPFRQVCGLVADLLRVSVEAAPLIEAALGELAEYVVLRPGRELLDHLCQQPYPFSGRVGFLWLEACEGAEGEGLEGRPGVLGRADQFVETEPPWQSLARRLLGRTWIVETLRHAVTLAAAGKAWHFVTLAGERLASDGTLSLGPRHASAGLISRRSELRALKSQLAELETRIEQAHSAVLRLDQQIGQDQSRLQAAETALQSASDALAECAHRITAAETRRAQLDQQQAALQAEQAQVAAETQAASAALDDARTHQRQTESELAAAEAHLAELAQQIARLEELRQARLRATTEAKVELAKSDQRLENLRARLRQFQESQEERERAAAEICQHLAECRDRQDEASRAILQAEALLADAYLRKESLQAESAGLAQRRAEVLAHRTSLAADLQRLRGRVHKLEERMHARELAASQLRLERSALADRLRDEYGIELAQLDAEPDPEERRRREEVQAEIDQLRQKINELGNVNLEALEELDQLEQRYNTLATQLKDLTEAKNGLLRIIDKINADSRKLFLDTLQTVRGHFVQLFRDLFGGGQAEILLEEGVDVLEGGVEIVARPPGKELRSISLLSGGEKTLTCVALLLALFRSRPSPFCVLDEVDAALDEANIDRFIQVLQGFLAWTQFIIVTHSKKTMTCATTLYGVTMQESGVSKPVSVRFEDVSDDGEILLPAAESPASVPVPRAQDRAA